MFQNEDVDKSSPVPNTNSHKPVSSSPILKHDDEDDDEDEDDEDEDLDEEEDDIDEDIDDEVQVEEVEEAVHLVDNEKENTGNIHFLPDIFFLEN